MFTCSQERLTSTGKFSKAGEGGWTIKMFWIWLIGEITYLRLCVCNFLYFSLVAHNIAEIMIGGAVIWTPLFCFKPFVNSLPHTYASCSPDLFPVRERIHDSDLDPPALPPRAPLLRQPSPSLTPGVQWADLAAIQSQLQIQTQVCNYLFNLTRCVRSKRRCFYILYYIVVRIDRFSLPLLSFQGNWFSYPEIPWPGKRETVTTVSHPDASR